MPGRDTDEAPADRDVRVRAGRSTADRWFPELRAGGFDRLDGTVAFYTRVRALVGPRSVVVDFGAGRGRFLEDAVPFRRGLQHLRGDVGRVIGLDVDEAVRDNQAVDEAHVITSGEPLPLPDASVDMLIADFVLEHVTERGWASREITRVLRPGGWICGRTPNKWGVIALGGRLVPNRHHVAALRRLQPGRRALDTFPTAYRMNSRRDLRACFPPKGFDHMTFAHDGGPAYAGGSRVGWAAFRLLSSFTPPRWRPTLFVFIQKR